MPQHAKSDRLDWPAERDRIDLVAVATRHLGPAPGRRGGGSPHWWRCPFHDDRNPSFQVKGRHWRCFGCGAEGDAVDLVRKLDTSLNFPDAVRLLIGGASTNARPIMAPKPEAAPADLPGAEWQAEANEAIDDAEARLWEPDGSEALAYLRDRGLSDETIRSARLGLSDGRRRGVVRGITIPWFDDGAPMMIQIRRPDGCEPKYKATKGSRRIGFYPEPAIIRPGRPVIIAEGEFDALLLGQELGELAAVLTLGSAGEKPTTADLGMLLAAYPWYIATDADQAGDVAAACWPSRGRRVRPPGGFNDWGKACEGRMNLRRWWAEILAGNPSPPLFTWEELSIKRWGPAKGDPTPGLIVD
jgi:hypothetical protein